MKGSRLNLEGKIEELNYASKNSKKGCRDIAAHFKIGKTASVSILKNAKSLQHGYKTKLVGQSNSINDILYIWYGKCYEAGIYPFGIMLQEEALKIKEKLNDNSLDDFVASIGWLEKWKTQNGIRETHLSGEADDVSLTTIKSWIERIPELRAIPYLISGIWTNLGYFLSCFQTKD